MPSKKKRTAKKQVTGRQRSVSQTEPTDLRKITDEKPHSLVREMEIRQIELQLQNEQLRKALMEAGEIRDYYSALYEYAPIGYITLNDDGQILEANLTAANMLGTKQQVLLRSNISNFVNQEYQDAWHLHWRAAFSSKTKLACEMEMRRADGTHLAVRLEGVFGPEKDQRCRTALIDVTNRKDAEKAQTERTNRLEKTLKKTEQELDHFRKSLKMLTAELMLAEERERRQVAEDVHDGLGQALFRARIKLGQLSTAEPAVGEIGTILEEIGRMMNTMTFELSPPVLRKVGLRAALQSLAREIRRQFDLLVEVEDDGQSIPLDERTSVIVFRSVRELLINVAKHAKTNRAKLSLRRIDDRLQVNVEDRGKGFDLAEQSQHVESGHLGLFSIRQRMEYVGGTSMVQSSPVEGTAVTLTAPLAGAKSAGSR